MPGGDEESTGGPGSVYRSTEGRRMVGVGRPQAQVDEIHVVVSRPVDAGHQGLDRR